VRAEGGRRGKTGRQSRGAEGEKEKNMQMAWRARLRLQGHSREQAGRGTV